MPKFAPNTGFKMPGVGSKNIDSPGNFRDEQHVDKVGYCDTTEDSMLPEGSSPLKARYTQSGYLKDLDAISIPKSGCPKGYTAVDGKCVAKPAKPEKEKKVKVKKRDGKKELEKTNLKASKAFGGAKLTVKAKALPGVKVSSGTDTRVVKKVPKNVTTEEGDKIYKNKTQKEKDAQDAAFEKIQKKNTKDVTQERKYQVIDGKRVLVGEFKDKT